MILNNLDYFHQANEFVPDFQSLRVRAENAFNETTQRVVDFVRSPEGQTVIGFGLGLALSTITVPLTSRVVTALGLPAVFAFRDLKIPPLIKYREHCLDQVRKKFFLENLFRPA